MKLAVIIPYFIRRCLPAILLLSMAISTGFGQSTGNAPVSGPGGTGGVKGRIHDTTLNRDCPLVVVALLQQDSTLVQFTRTKRDGSWSFRDIPAGHYQILISHPSYDDYTAPVNIAADSMTDLGRLILAPKSDSLSAVIVTPKSPPIHMRGDTLEYNTANMKLKVNATVEELLSRLPGVQVDQNGVITVNGQKVQRLLVDGEDIFSGDPTIVTRNFNADMIAKVQVLDKKSSQAEFTGIDDGQRTKTVNLTLKEDSKKGYFVKAEAGAGDGTGDGPQGYYNTNGLLGSFKGHRQFAALGMVANNGTTGFSGGSGDVGGGLSIGSGGDALGGSAGSGIPQVEGAGAHYANKWNGNEDHVSANGSLGHLVTHPFSTSINSQFLSGDSTYTQNQSSQSVNSNDQHNFNADYDYIPDTVSAFRLSLGGMNSDGRNQFSSTGNSLFNDTLVNSSVRTINSVVHDENFRGNLMWRIRSRKKKTRNFAVVVGMARQDNTTNGYLYSLNNFYQPNGTLLSADTTDQRKVISTSGLFLNSSLNYTQPLWKDAVLAMSYGLSFNNSQSLQSTYNRGGDAKYQAYVDSLSNHYQNDVLTQRTTINLQVSNRPLSYTIGGDLLQYAYKQQDLLKDSVLRYSYLNIAPRINMRYNVSKFRSVSFDYSGNTQQPSITQLQPVQNNNDPLHITLGNPDLHPSFSHHFGMGFNSIKPVMFNVGMNFGFTTNSISTKTYTDSLGRQISQAVNINGGSENAGLYLGLNHKLMPVGIDLGVNMNGSYGRNTNYVGALLSNNDNYNAGGGLSLGKFVADKYSVRFNSNVNYSYTRSSISAGAVTKYWTQSHNAELSYFPLPGLEINSNCYYTWRQKTSVFDKDNSTMLWNAYIGKMFLSNRLSIKWRINDILGQNAGVNRSSSYTQSSQTTTNIIGRYWMLSASWRFMKHGSVK